MRFFSGSDIVFGSGSIQQLPELLKPWNGQKVMIVSDPGVTAAGIAGRVQRILEEGGLQTRLFSEVQANPTNENVNRAARLARDYAPDLFVAVGGGSSIDLAKAVSLLMTNPDPIEAYGGIGNVPKKGLPLAAVPTTSGTSSEITNVCALIDTKKVVKYVIIDNKLTPDLVVADPELCRTVPAGVTAATGMDAITHAIESYISREATPLSEYHSMQGLKILYHNLPIAYESGGNIAVREQMMLGCLITGFGFSNANLGLVHGNRAHPQRPFRDRPRRGERGGSALRAGVQRAGVQPEDDRYGVASGTAPDKGSQQRPVCHGEGDGKAQ